MKTFRLTTILLISLILVSYAHGKEGVSVRQKLFMPGPVISGHIKYESQCETCHSSFDKQEMTSLCLDCHKDIALDRKMSRGFHGQMNLASTSDCQLCHKDHNGRDANIIGLQESSFDHYATNFPLTGGHQTIACKSCHHDNEIKHRDTPSECIDCHKSDDVHKGATGDKCETCHQDTRWQTLKTFDHDTTDFNLKGAHKEINCMSCHITHQYNFANTSCSSCHLSSDVHGGNNGKQCENCHEEQRWSSVIFDHNKTNFPLLYKHQKIPCLACHEPKKKASDAPTDCSGCHQKNDIHLGRNSQQCETCHTSKVWDNIIFDHDNDTNFLLTGKHHDVTCTQCHIGALDEPLSRACAGCHKADDIHNSTNMNVCGVCHNTDAWQSTKLFDHDFTDFPLIGMHRIAPCSTCHIGNQFAETSKKCLNCHETNDVHQESMGESCDQCHNPNAWNPWNFDHNTETIFKLDGKHENLSCDSCHQAHSPAKGTSKVCGTCHKNQDIHNSEFGLRCDRCHSTSGFFELFLR